MTSNTTMDTSDGNAASSAVDHLDHLPSNRFELELEFVQALASPAYLHFLATYRDADGVILLQDRQFLEFLQYLHKTWTQPAYARFLSYPHALFFLKLLCDGPNVATLAREWSLPAFRDFCHQQQFLAWQHRHESLYGRGTNSDSTTTTIPEDEKNEAVHATAAQQADDPPR
jgi:mediator of RNA polymerase II transcription subunit 31